MDIGIIYSFIYCPFLALLIGWVLDLMFGDPERLPHPIVYMGKWIAFWEKRLNKGENRKAKGAALAVGSILLTYGLVKVLIVAALALGVRFPYYNDGVYVMNIPFVILSSALIFFCLAGHTLRKEVRMVFEAVDRSLEDGRKQVARIVGRDTNELSAQEVRTAALETLAENLSDGVIAPLFWLAIFGVPGMMAYKMVNTLDSMIGYQNPRYKDFGCWAAHIDDIANYIPARLSALLIIVSSLLFVKGKSFVELCKFTLHFGPQHASPNSGWPEAALAGILDCRFGGSHNYFGENFYKPHIGTNPRLLTTNDMKISIKLMIMSEIVMIAIVCLWFAFCPY